MYMNDRSSSIVIIDNALAVGAIAPSCETAGANLAQPNLRTLSHTAQVQNSHPLGPDVHTAQYHPSSSLTLVPVSAKPMLSSPGKPDRVTTPDADAAAPPVFEAASA